jgi:divalent metal cation (Fe/Co/Zn/Cd) transporter
MFSDALNSFTDIVGSIIVYHSLKVSGKKPDKGHQYGHTRAQPIAGLIVSLFACLVGFQVIIFSIDRFFAAESMEKGLIPIFIIIIVIITKTILYVYT